MGCFVISVGYQGKYLSYTSVEDKNRASMTKRVTVWSISLLVEYGYVRIVCLVLCSKKN